MITIENEGRNWIDILNELEAKYNNKIILTVFYPDPLTRKRMLVVRNVEKESIKIIYIDPHVQLIEEIYDTVENNIKELLEE